MDGERSDGGGGGGGGAEPEVEDEFACAGMLRGSLTSLHATVERIFRVAFRIGEGELPHGNNGQIWLKLRGPSRDVKAAKLFVRGLVNQEEQQEVSYPGVLHCVFCGARGLFMDCLIKSTSAHIVVGSPGFLLISGLAEPVVRAYSLIMDLVERYEGTQSRRCEAADRGSGESLDSRRAFKSLVEKWEDRHVLDLLVLPGSVKEILLDLARESGLGAADGNARPRDKAGDRWDKPSAVTYALAEPPGRPDRRVEGMTAGSGKDSFRALSASSGIWGRPEGAEERLTRSPQEVGEEEQPQRRETLGTEDVDRLGEEEEEEEEEEQQSSMGNKEFFLLLKFFTAMGYTEDVVKRVLARTGPKEASQILDLVQQEQDRSDREQGAPGGPDPQHQDGSGRNRPCETEHMEDEETAAGGDQETGGNVEAGEVREGEEGGAAGSAGHPEGGGADEKEEGHEEDFVLGVLKKAAASCGYTEQEVAKVYNMLPGRSTHQLLLELQREGGREGPRETDDMVLDKEGPRAGPDDEGWADPAAEPDPFPWSDRSQQPPAGRRSSQQHAPHQLLLPEVKGPPMPTYPPSPDLPLAAFQTSVQHDRAAPRPNPPASKQNHSADDDVFNPKSSNHVKRATRAPRPGNESSPTRARERRGFPPASSVAVTGEQRFLEGLQTPFDLNLTDQPGDAKLRGIIIDGSNVAMSHGLGHFFSCRGIALAVQHFWDRGHRVISALLPQWRQKSDPRIKEQHYLTELQTLGLLAYTPSREVQGKRISSYDDRFMLQLAQKTNGVIVTNDNLRDLSDESPVWRDIIKKRLLQYTFVGDHFMVPDDPLGRGGPHLDDFLRSEHRTPDPGNHSFAGVATTFPSSNPPRSQTEVLNFRDRTLVGGGGSGPDPASRGGRGKGRGHGKGWGVGHQNRQRGAAGPGLTLAADRKPEETIGLWEQLCQVFPGQDYMVTLVLQCHPAETDVNVLSDLILEQID